MKQIIEWFSKPGIANFSASILSLLALAVSIVALVISRKNQKRLVEIEEAREHDRLRLLRKANLIAQIKREVLITRHQQSVNQYFLCVDNTGNAEARDIVILLDGKPLLEHPTILDNTKEIRQVGPNSHFQYLLALNMQAHSPSDVKITWSDDSEEPGSYQTTLTL